MKFNFMYGTSCLLTVIDTTGGHWDYSTTFNNVQEAFNFAEDIFNGYTVWDAKNIDVIYITDKNTGEILVECSHDERPNVEYDDTGYIVCPHKDEHPNVEYDDTGYIVCLHKDEHPNVEYDDEGNTICLHEWDDVNCEDCEIQNFCNL